MHVYMNIKTNSECILFAMELPITLLLHLQWKNF